MISPWINFEAGAISKGLGKSRVSPILFGLSKSDVSGPLSQFQLSDFDKEEIWKIVCSLNVALAEEKIADAILQRSFEKWWPDLEEGVRNALETTDLTSRSAKRDTRDLLEENLTLTRELQRAIQKLPIQAKPPNAKPSSIVLLNLAGLNRKIADLILELRSEDVIGDHENDFRMVLRNLIRLNHVIGKRGGKSLEIVQSLLSQMTKLEPSATAELPTPDEEPASES